MKPKLLLAPLLMLTCLRTEAQSFSSGSDGSYGAMNITNFTTLDLPTNGIFNCTTITVAGGATLRFNLNALNTPVFLLATSNVTINGSIDVSGDSGTSLIGGSGGPGGFDGGNPQFGTTPASAGCGPGGGRPGSNGSGEDGAGSGSYFATGPISK